MIYFRKQQIYEEQELCMQIASSDPNHPTEQPTHSHHMQDVSKCNVIPPSGLEGA